MTREENKMEGKAIARSVRISPIKARLVVDLIRGKKADEAVTILENRNKRSSGIVLKALNSAISNAVNNFNLDKNKLYVKEARVDAGPVMKRVMFDSRSHIGHKDRRTSHIIVVVAEK